MEDPEAVAKGICLRALTGTAKTRKQLAELLAKKEVPEEAANAVLDRFTDVGLIDDAAFAAAWVTSRQSGRGLARRALAAELRAKGVDGEVAAAAVAEVDPQSEWDSARRLVERKVPSMRRLDRVTAERRLMGMLARKGYGGGLAGYVVREALDADGAAEDAAAEAEPLEAEPSGSTQSRTPPARATPSRTTSFGGRSA
ncbi:MAG TPA: regulatory protein RecX, partial [Acidimicrobiales bacterium]